MLVSFPDTISQGIFCTRYYTATSSVHPTIYSSAIKQNTGTAVQLHPEFYRFFSSEFHSSLGVLFIPTESSKGT